MNHVAMPCWEHTRCWLIEQIVSHLLIDDGGMQCADSMVLSWRLSIATAVTYVRCLRPISMQNWTVSYMKNDAVIKTGHTRVSSTLQQILFRWNIINVHNVLQVQTFINSIINTWCNVAPNVLMTHEYIAVHVPNIAHLRGTYNNRSELPVGASGVLTPKSRSNADICDACCSWCCCCAAAAGACPLCLGSLMLI